MTRTEHEHAVGIIPANAPFSASGDLMRGFSRCYPEHALRLADDALTGGYMILFDPAATAPPPGSTGGAADTSREPATLGMTTSLGVEEQADLFTMILQATEDDEVTGVKILAGMMRSMLDQHDAANYLTHTFDYTDGQRYALTIQRVTGFTPAEKIAALQQEKADLEAALAHALAQVESLEIENEAIINS
jgi:hypothetical protein